MSLRQWHLLPAQSSIETPRRDRTIVAFRRSYTWRRLGDRHMEHRWGHRREISRAVQLGTRSGVAARGRISNVSISGAFVTSSLPASLYSYVEIQFTALLDGKRTRMTVEGQVVRKEPGGFGVEWCEFAPEAVRALVTVPAFRQAEPPQPHAEWEWEPVARPHPRIMHH